MNKRYLQKRTKWLIGGLASTLVIIPLIAVSAIACSSEFSMPSISITNKLKNKYLVFGSKSFNSPRFSINAESNDHNGKIVYQWYKNNCISTVSGTPIIGATNSSYIVKQPNILNPGIVYYYVVASLKVGAKILNSEISNIAQVKEIDFPIIDIVKQPNNQNATVGQTENLPVFSAEALINDPNIALKYQWYESDSDSVNGAVPINGATNKIYQITNQEVLKQSKEYFFVKISAMLNGIDLVSKNSDFVILNVKSTPTINITNNPVTEQKLIVGQTTGLPKLSVSASNHSGTKLTYQWYKNDTNSTTGGTVISGANQPTYPINSNDVKRSGTKYYYVKISGTTKNGVIVKPIFSSISKIIISPLPTISVHTQPQNVSVTATQAQSLPVLSVKATSSNAAAQLHYQLYSSASKTNTSGSEISGATSPTYQITAAEAASVGDKYFYVKISGAINGAQLAPVTSEVATLNVSAVPTISITAQPKANETLIAGQTQALPTLAVTASSVSGAHLSYQWYESSTDSTNNGTAITGATQSTYTIPTSLTKTIGRNYYYVEIKGKISNGINLTPVYSNPSKIIIAPIPTIKINKQPQNVFAIATQSENLPVLSVNAITVISEGQMSYQWYETNTNSTTNGKLIPGATSSTYQINAADATSIGDKYFYVKISGSINGIKLNSVTSNIALLNIEPIPTITITKQPKLLKKDILLGTKTPPTLSVTAISSNPDVPLVYQWFKELGFGNLSAGSGKVVAIPGANQSTYTVPTNQVGETEYYVMVSLAWGIQKSFAASNSVIVNIVADHAKTI